MSHCTKTPGVAVNSKVTARKALCVWWLCVLGRQQWGVCVSPQGNVTPSRNCPALGVKSIPVTSHLMGKGKGWLTPEQTQWWDAGLSSLRHCSKLSQKPKKTEKMPTSKLPDRKQNTALMSLGWDWELLPCPWSQGVYSHRKSMGWTWCSWWLQVELAALLFNRSGSAVTTSVIWSSFSVRAALFAHTCLCSALGSRLFCSESRSSLQKSLHWANSPGVGKVLCPAMDSKNLGIWSSHN